MVKKIKRRKADDESSSQAFKEGDIVGAQVKGFPMWPARIETITYDAKDKIKRIVVRFYSTNDTYHFAQKDLSKVKHFKNLTEKELNCKRPYFKDALKLCLEEIEQRGGDQQQHDDSQSDDDQLLVDERPENLRSNVDTADEGKQTDLDQNGKEPKVDTPKRRVAKLDSQKSQVEELSKNQSKLDEKEPRVERSKRKHSEVDPPKEREPSLERPRRKSSKIETPKEIETKVERSRRKDSRAAIKQTEIKDKEEESESNDETPEEMEPNVAITKKREHKVEVRNEKQPQNEPPNEEPKVMEMKKPRMPKTPKVDNKLIAITTITKLKNKIEMKRREKELLKKQKKEVKIADKLTEKLGIIQDRLALFSIFKDKLKRTYAPKTLSNKICNTAVQMFSKILPALERCIKLILELEVTELKDSFNNLMEEFENTMTDILQDLKSSIKNDKLPPESRSVAKSCMHEAKTFPHIKKLVNDGYQSLAEEMLEKKENNVKKHHQIGC